MGVERNPAGRRLMDASTRRAAEDYSRGPRTPKREFPAILVLGVAMSAAAFLGPILLLAADFSTLFEVRAASAVVDTTSGGDHHAYALIPIALLALPMAYGAATSGSRPAMAALGVLGGVAAIIVLAVDLPDINSTGVIGERFADAAASPRRGFYLETLGAALLIVSGFGGLLLTGRGEIAPAAALRGLKLGLPERLRRGASSEAAPGSEASAERDESARAAAAARRAARRRGTDS